MHRAVQQWKIRSREGVVLSGVTPSFLPQPWCSIRLNDGELRLSHVGVKASIQTDSELTISSLAVREIIFQ